MVDDLPHELVAHFPAAAVVRGKSRIALLSALNNQSRCFASILMRRSRAAQNEKAGIGSWISRHIFVCLFPECSVSAGTTI
jgi:hypothetical protein